MNKKIGVVFGWAVILTAWAPTFAAESPKTILFDTGAKGDLLLANFDKMKLRPGDVDLVVISHHHGDHTGGLLPFLATNQRVDVYPPAATARCLAEPDRPFAVLLVAMFQDCLAELQKLAEQSGFDQQTVVATMTKQLSGRSMTNTPPDEVQNILQRTGMGENEAIESRMVGRRIQEAARKIERQAVSDLRADSAEEWLQLNCPEMWRKTRG
jgi:metal-dependent hydrolase (beta-lactamase superfamily II)